MPQQVRKLHGPWLFSRATPQVGSSWTSFFREVNKIGEVLKFVDTYRGVSLGKPEISVARHAELLHRSQPNWKEDRRENKSHRGFAFDQLLRKLWATEL
jgi:hypothetical protein